MAHNRFRPQDMSKPYVMKQRLKYGRSDSYNWQTRIEWYPVGFKVNNKTIFKQFGRLHYLACHSPENIQKKWQSAYNVFMKKHFGDSEKASIRYLNEWSCHNWL